MADIEWIKLNIDIFDNRKIKYIRRLPNGDSITLIWIMLLTMAGNCNNNGAVYVSENIPYDDEILAAELNFPKEIVAEALKIFKELGMIFYEKKVIFISNWSKYQNLSSLEKARESKRLAQAKWRKKKSELSTVESTVESTKISTVENVDVLRRVSVDYAEEEKEKEEEKERDKEIYNGDSDNEIELFFEEVWEKYPRKNGKGHVRLATKRRLYKEVGLEHMLRCIERYKKYIAEHRITEEYIKYGSSFFNGGYIDYLDENYVAKPKDQVKEEPKPTYFDCYGLAHPTDVQDYARFDRFRNLTKEQIQHFVDKGSFNMETGGLDGLYLTKDEIKLLQEKGVV